MMMKKALIFWTFLFSTMIAAGQDSNSEEIRQGANHFFDAVKYRSIGPFHDPGAAYIATTRYKFNDHQPGLYKTKNYGRDWVNISDGIPTGAYTRVVREDEERPGMLIAGTETGIYISWDDGASWESIQLNLPVTPVNDLVSSHGDLIVATSGRSFWILDDLAMIRQYDHQPKENQLYQPEAFVLSYGGSELNRNSKEFKGSHPLRGVNPAFGAVIYYYLAEISDSVAVEIEIRDAEEQLVRRFSSQKKSGFVRYAGGPPLDPTLPLDKGLNRFVWDLRYSAMIGAPQAYIEGSYRGHQVSPGTYTITLKQGDKEMQSSIEIIANPLYSINQDQYEEYHDFMSNMEMKINAMHELVNAIYKQRGQLENVIKDLPKGVTNSR